MKKTLFFDIEGYSAGTQLNYTPREYVRLFQYAWGDGPVKMTTDYGEMLSIIRSADYVVGHNIISYDLTAIFGYDSIEPLYMAMERKVVCTFYLAQLLTPAPPFYKMRNGRRAVETTDPVGHAMSWLSLDNLCYQFNLEGKLGDLKELAKKYQPEGTKVADYEYGLIDLNDPDFKAYAEQDVIAVRSLYKYLLEQVKIQEYPGEYIWREMELLSATVGQMHRNGILVNQEYANERIQEQEVEKEKTLAWLVENYDFPTEGRAPWSTTAGKEATLRALADFGFTPENTPEWERTPKGAPKLGGKDLLTFTQGTPAEDFCVALGALKGLRAISQTVMDNIKPDGKVHPDITSLQRSGRWSFTKPGVTIFGERNERLKADKALFTAAEGNVMAGFDYSSADARAMAGLSGDHEYNKRFETDEEGNDLHDAHNLTGEAVFGVDAYYTGWDGPRDAKARPPLRPATKPIGHGSNYQIGAYKLANGINQACREEGLDLFFWAPAGKNKDGTHRAKPIPAPERFSHVVKDDALTGEPIPEGMFLARDILESMKESYPFLTRLKEDAYKFGEENGYIENSWGRRMQVIKDRAYTQAPAQLGQGTTREMMGDAILRLIRKGEYYIRSMRAIIHDELLLEFKEDTIERDIQVVKECMEVDFVPHTPQGFPIRFPVGHGFGRTWRDASH